MIGLSESVRIDGRDLLAAGGVPSPIDDVPFCNPLGRIVGELDKGESGRFPGAVYELRVIHGVRDIEVVNNNS